MLTNDPRFEFRTFGDDLDTSIKLMEELCDPASKRSKGVLPDEIYIVSKENDINNVKIRNSKLEIKTLTQTSKGLEQWKPSFSAKFPISGTVLNEFVFPAFMVEAPLLKKQEYRLEEFLREVEANSRLYMIKVQKERFSCIVENVICEASNIVIGNKKMLTVCCESVNIDDIKRTLDCLKLENRENINYIQQIKLVLDIL